MEQGLITNPKDLQNMSHALESLERRITSLEDTELEIMERLEETQGELTRAQDEQQHTEARLGEPAAARDEAAAAIPKYLPAAPPHRVTTPGGTPQPPLDRESGGKGK